MKKLVISSALVVIIITLWAATPYLIYDDTSSAVVADTKNNSVILPPFGKQLEKENDYVTPDNYLINNFEVIYQMPELPTGCEITAMDMVLNYYGYYIDKVELATEYLPTILYGERINDENVTDKSDLSSYFIGNPATHDGTVAGSNAVTIAANNYLDAINADYSAINISGSSTDKLYEYVSKDMPVAVWVTIYMKDRPETKTIELDGSSIEWSNADHGAVLVGYTDKTVTIADPISGMVEYDRGQFEKVYISRGLNAVILKKDNYN